MNDTPARGRLLVRPVDTDETLGGGRIVLTAETRERMTAHQCEVIAVGAAEVCDDEDCEREHFTLQLSEFQSLGKGAPPPRVFAEVREHPIRAVAGDWLLVRPRSFLAGPNPERAEWFIHQDDILAILRLEDDHAEEVAD